MKKELEGLEIWAKAKIHENLLRTTLKNIKLENAQPEWSTWILVKEIHLHLWQTSTRNEQMPIRSRHTRLDEQKKTTLIQSHPQRNRPKQLQAHNVLTYDVLNTKGTNKPQIAPRGIERMLQSIQRHRGATLHWSAHPQRKQVEAQKCSYCLDWLQKSTWYGPTKLDNKLP